MFCHVCGKKMAKDAGFCHSCGAKRVAEGITGQNQDESDMSRPSYTLETPAHMVGRVTQNKNHIKVGAIVAIILLISIIGLISFFALRTGSEDESILVDTPTVSAYATESDGHAYAQEIEYSMSETPQLQYIEESPFEPLVDTNGWIRMGYLRMPPAWDFGEVHRLCGSTGEIIPSEEATRYDRQRTILGNFENDIWMSAEFSIHDHPVVDTVAILYDALNNHTSSRIVNFDDRHSLVMYELPDRIVWLHESEWGDAFTIVNLYHNGDRSIFENDEDTIMTIVSTIFGNDRNAVAIRRGELDRQRFAAELTAERIANAGVTLDNFESLRLLMSHYVVSQILGSSGVLSSVNRTPSSIHELLYDTWRTYIWDGPDAGSSITILFRNGSLYSMSQTGLR